MLSLFSFTNQNPNLDKRDSLYIVAVTIFRHRHIVITSGGRGPNNHHESVRQLTAVGQGM